jgi:hypothetical protein
MDEAFAARIDDGEHFPEASPPRKGEYVVAPSTDLSAKAALYLAMKEAAISKVALARTLRVDEKEVRRLLDPHHPSKLPRMEEALRALGKRLVLSLQPAVKSAMPAASARGNKPPSTRGRRSHAKRRGSIHYRGRGSQLQLRSATGWVLGRYTPRRGRQYRSAHSRRRPHRAPSCHND